ncbi:MAG TPA: molybdopterin converting factor subunit 1 [Ktedonobacteraceae bacterium]|nr:molybdopterin converting factor subunit 1 [Ktedonobacteraceae bacterium]
MKIHLRYFASFKEIIGQSEEILMVPEGATVEDVQATLLARCPRLQPVIARCKCAVNRSYVPAATVLHEQDELVFIPPIGGGR